MGREFKVADKLMLSKIYKEHQLFNNGSLKFEITAKRLYAASQRVL